MTKTPWSFLPQQLLIRIQSIQQLISASHERVGCCWECGLWLPQYTVISGRGNQKADIIIGSAFSWIHRLYRLLGVTHFSS